MIDKEWKEKISLLITTCQFPAVMGTPSLDEMAEALDYLLKVVGTQAKRIETLEAQLKEKRP